MKELINKLAYTFIFLLVSKLAISQTPKDDLIDISTLSDNFDYDFRYATENNFLKEKVYDCSKCFLRKDVAKNLVKANDSLHKLGYKIKLYDCYRPVSVQKKMWKILPDGRYVANPNKRWSIHNRGGAVDLTIVKLDGTKVEMGTDFDHFGKEAHHNYINLDKQILNNRILLKNTLLYFGFNSIN